VLKQKPTERVLENREISALGAAQPLAYGAAALGAPDQNA
jgi:hypothetical protein